MSLFSQLDSQEKRYKEKKEKDKIKALAVSLERARCGKKKDNKAYFRLKNSQLKSK